MTQILGYDFVKQFESVFPPSLAEDNDPIGLHVGDLSRPVHKVMVSLDVRPEVVDEAISQNVDFILAHHPPIFSPIKRLDLSNKQNHMYAQLIKHDITVYAAHTNVDNAKGGMNDWLAEALKLNDLEIMDVSKTIPLKRLNVYVPLEQVEEVRRAITAAGAGAITENYKDCSYSLRGVGRFTPINNADPTIGEVSEPEEVEEERVEVILEAHKVPQVLKAMMNSHPYEEPVYELYSIDKNQPQAFGLGRVGNLPEAMDLNTFADLVKQTFGLDGLRIVQPAGRENQTIKRVAICGGSAGKYYPKAIQKGADVYITGDITYHTAHDIQADGLTVIDPGHNIEKICIPKFHSLIMKWKEEMDWDINVIQSETNTEPFKFY